MGYPHSSANNQLLHIEIHDPVFEMNVYNADKLNIQGRQMNNTFLPTYTIEGVDETAWLASLVSYYQISGNVAPPDPMFHLYTTKVTFHFRGLRCMLTNALDLYLPDEEEEMKKNYVNTSHAEIRRRKRTHPPEERQQQYNMGNDIKVRKPN